jgi:flagellar hook-associated protein 2
VTLNLSGFDPSTTVALTLAPDTTAIEASITDFVSAYNTLITDVNSQFKYDSATAVGGALQTDSVIQGFQSDLLTAADYSTGSGTIQTLASLGITTNSDGTLSINTSSLVDAVTNNFSEVQSFFQSTATTSFVSSFETKLNTYTDTSQGAFTIDLSSINSENTDLTDQIDTLEIYLASQQTSLTAEYNNADIALAQLPQTIKQVDALLNPNSSSS